MSVTQHRAHENVLNVHIWIRGCLIFTVRFPSVRKYIYVTLAKNIFIQVHITEHFGLGTVFYF